MDRYTMGRGFFIFIVIIALLSALYLAFENQKELALAFLSIMIASISIVLGIDSLILGKKSTEIAEGSKAISEKAKEIAEDSDNKVNSIANANFLRAIGQIEDLRLDFKNRELILNEDTGKLLFLPKLITKREICGWKCLTYIREANEILRYSNIRTFNIKRFLNLFNKYIEQTKVERHNFSCEEIHHIFMMYKRIFDLEDFLDDEKLKEANFETKINRAIRYLREILDEDEDAEIGLEFIKNYDEIIRRIFTQDNIENRKIIFYSIIDTFKTQYLDITQ